MTAPSRTAEYRSHVRRQMAYGRWHPLEWAQPSRTLVRRCMEAGIGKGRFAELSGVPVAVLSNLLYGDPSRGLLPSRKIRAETAAQITETASRILSGAIPGVLAGGATVAATGTVRRLRALVALGHSETRIAPVVPMAAVHLRCITRGERDMVTARTARGVAAAYGRLQYEAPPEGTAAERMTATKCRNRAAARGWAAPAAWDGCDIDDPAAVPDTGYAPPPRAWIRPDDGDIDEISVELMVTGERRVPLSPRERELAARLIVERGGNRQQIVDRLHVNGTLAAELMAEAQAAIAAEAASAECAA